VPEVEGEGRKRISFWNAAERLRGVVAADHGKRQKRSSGEPIGGMGGLGFGESAEKWGGSTGGAVKAGEKKNMGIVNENREHEEGMGNAAGGRSWVLVKEKSGWG